MMTKTYTPTRREKLKIWFEKDAFEHNVFTPFELCTEIISHVDVSDHNILVMNPEFALVLIEEFGVDPSRITIFADVDPIIETIARRMGINYIDAWNYNMKFDVVFANPPYEGQKSLHQRFFNKAVEELVDDGGTVCFLQPAVIYHNKKENPRKPTVQMRNHVIENTTRVYFVNSSVFENAAITGQCSVTVLTKDGSNSGVIELVQTVSGSTFNDVDLEYVNQQDMDIDTYKSIVEKIKAKAEEGGSLHSLCRKSSEGTIFALPKVRGHSGTNDFYTFIPRDGFDTSSDWGIAIDSETQHDNVRSYLKTTLARFAFSIRKYSVHLYAGELSLVPQVDFDQEWSDEKLMAEWGITEEEYAEILKVIPAYYDR